MSADNGKAPERSTGPQASTPAPAPAPTPASASAPSQAVQLRRKFKLPRTSHLNIDKVTALTGKDNYQSWADQVTMIFKAVGLYDVVVNGAKPINGDSNDDWKAYNEIVSEAVVVLVRVVTKPIMTIIGRIRDPHQIWRHLRAQYYSDTAYSFVHKLHVLFTLGSTYDSSKPIGEFIETFETEWAMLEQLATSSSGSSGTNSYPNTFLACDEAKRDILLSALIPHMENIIDNISTKSDMTFAEAKSRLISLPSHQKQQDAALIVETNGKKAWKKRSNNKSSDSNDKPWCTYCKKHNFTPCKGHTWKTCRRLKEKQKQKRENLKKKKEEKKDEPTESAHVTDITMAMESMHITTDPSQM